MKITKRQLKRIIREEKVRLMEYGGRPYDPTVPGDWKHQEDRMMAYPTEDATAELLINHYKKWVKDNGHVTPAASSVMATYFVSRDRDDPVTQGWNHRTLADEFGIGQDDLTSELKRQRAERAAMMGESKMKITKRQLKRIIREEKIRLLVEEEDANKEAFQTLVDSVSKAAKDALAGGLSKEEIATAVQGMIDDMG